MGTGGVERSPGAQGFVTHFQTHTPKLSHILLPEKVIQVIPQTRKAALFEL